MAYDVTKVVNGRSYRYRVRSERDPATGKHRNRWTYLGRAGAEAAAPRPARRTNAREALLDALERLLETRDHDALTASAVSAEAGLAHGTFYRYFRNKAEAIHAVLERVRAARDGERAMLLDVAENRVEARAALRRWATALLRSPAEHRGVIRAFYELAQRDPEIAAAKAARRIAYAEQLADHLRVLVARGWAHVDDPSATAAALFAMLDGFFREAIAGGESLDAARLCAALDLIERGVFGSLA